MIDGHPWRHFTLEEANVALATIRPTLLELREDHAALESARREFGEYAHTLKRYRLLVESHRIEGEIGQLVARIQQGIRTITAYGVEVKNIEIGLIDFPALRNGEVVYLCYRLDEPGIIAWHPIETGFAGRKPIAEF